MNFPHAPYRRVSFFVLFALAACLAPLSVSATWSIVAVDTHTGEVGSAAATCTGFAQQIVGVAPGRGAIVAQADSNHQARRRGVQMLMAGARPETVIRAVANPKFDPDFRERQYGVVTIDFGAASAAFTGSDTFEWNGHAIARGVAVQGNILTGPEVVEAAKTAFTTSERLWLGERLLQALEAGSFVGGDRRCGKQDALSSYLIVARPDDPLDDPYLKLIVPEQPPGGPNPVQVLREQFEVWIQAPLVEQSVTRLK